MQLQLCPEHRLGNKSSKYDKISSVLNNIMPKCSGYFCGHCVAYTHTVPRRLFFYLLIQLLTVGVVIRRAHYVAVFYHFLSAISALPEFVIPEDGYHIGPGKLCCYFNTPLTRLIRFLYRYVRNQSNFHFEVGGFEANIAYLLHLSSFFVWMVFYKPYSQQQIAYIK